MSEPLQLPRIACTKCGYTVSSRAALACLAFVCPARFEFRQQSKQAAAVAAAPATAKEKQ